MAINETILTMMTVQNNTNTILCGEDWENGYCNGDRPTSFELGLLDELNEAWTSFDWKHWSPKEDDISNFKLELADIMFHLLSLFIINKETFENEIVKMSVNGIAPTVVIVDLIRIVSNAIANNRSHITNNSLKIMLKKLLGVMDEMGITIEEIAKVHSAKAILTVFRNKHGYNNGTYVKEWLGGEDNAYLMQLIDTCNTNEDIKPALEVKYKEVLLYKEHGDDNRSGNYV